jgi:AraC-like DNA-binding protein
MKKVSKVLAQAVVSSIVKAHPVLRKVKTRFNYCSIQSEDLYSQISMAELEDFFVHAVEITQDENIGVAAYHGAHPGNLGLLGYAMMSGATIGSALQQIADNHQLFGAGFCLYLEQGATVQRLIAVQTSEDPAPPSKAVVDSLISITLGLLHWLSNGEAPLPSEVQVSYAQPEQAGLTLALQKMYGSNIKFSSGVNSIAFETDVIERKILTHDAELCAIHANFISRKKLEVLGGGAACFKVEQKIIKRMNQFKVFDLRAVSSALGLSVNQLTRALEAEGESFEGLVDSVRYKAALHQLRNTDSSFKEIAYRIGFKNQSALNKACLRWFGVTPGQVRRQGAE